ncbi:MAG: thymidine phosphorylase [Acidobacteria bacterium]|nr:thymidine phosphorylase [Acidobacteriota bacterium]
MRPQEIITIKRDGGELLREQIGVFVDGVCDGSWADYQISAMVMAMFTRGLSDVERDELTRAMLYSGEVMDLSDIALPKVDKHSTGGVGDKTSLVIAPLLAACGVAVPMISGRGLGHTGGTLDKLESIPGYNVDLTTEEFHRIVKTCGFAMSGQTADIAPADKKLYALRDATATVPYIPLIVASIMSKKLAEGLDALVLDVKTGSGAFMQNYEDSVKLAEALVQTGNNAGVKTQAIVTDMQQPLGRYVGNAVEVYECVKILRGETVKGSEDTLDLSVELTARLLVSAGIATDLERAHELANAKIQNGEALEKFRENCRLQGSGASVCDEPESILTNDLIEHRIVAKTGGFVTEADARSIGEAVVIIGGGRTRAEDTVDHSVGYSCEAKIGDEVRTGDVLGVLYCRRPADADRVSEKLESAYKINAEPPIRSELVKMAI